MTRTSRSATPRGDSFHARLFTTFVIVILASCNAVAGEAPRPAPSPAAAPQLEVLPILVPVAGSIRLEPVGRMPEVLPPVLRMADGSLHVDLSGIFFTNAIAMLGWDGQPVISCVEASPEAFQRWLTVTALTPTARGRARAKE